MNSLKTFILIAFPLILCSCSKGINANASTSIPITNSMLEYDELVLYKRNTKYYHVPDFENDTTVSLSKGSFMYFYENALTLWTENTTSSQYYGKYTFSVSFYRYKVVGKFLFKTIEEPQQSLIAQLNKVEDLNKELLNYFYDNVPLEGVRYYNFYGKLGKDTILRYLSTENCIYATFEAAKELGVTFIE